MQTEVLGPGPQTEFQDVTPLESCCRYSGGRWNKQTLRIVREMPLTVFINGQELVTLLCTPNRLNQLVLGFLHLEGLIRSADEVAYLRVCAEDAVADVRLLRESVELPSRRVLTSGCGGGVGLAIDLEGVPRLEIDTHLTPEQVLSLPNLLREHSRLYPLCGGVHTSMLSDGDRVLAIAEDVGRHNTLDKIDGECLLTGMPTEGRILCTTGRISSEMLAKAAKMRVPVVVSRTSPTNRAVAIAQELGITVVGYVRGGSFSVYTYGHRIEGCAD